MTKKTSTKTESTSSVTIPRRVTIEDLGTRLRKIQHALSLAHGCAHALSQGDTFQSALIQDELTEAMEALLLDAIGEMYWLTLLPEFALQLPAPCDDDLNAYADEARDKRTTLLLEYFADVTAATPSGGVQ